MEAKELRIGNWVNGNKPYQITITELVTQDYYDKVLFKPYCEPIPLTEEWLLKFGFEWETNKKTHIQRCLPNAKLLEPSKICFYQLGNSFEKHCQLYQDGYLDGMFTTFAIEYVHQLQNLYFALTGEELTLNT